LEDRTTPSGGLLDPTFGSGGTVLNNFGSSQHALTDVKVLTDGELLTVGYVNGDFAAARYNADGTFDTSFGSGGLATVSFNGGGDQAWAAAVQPGSGGKILVAGTANVNGSKFGVVRLNPNGTIDTTFGGKRSGGKVTASPGARNASYAYSMAVLPDGSGKFVLAGLTMNLGNSGSGSISLARFNADGTLDTTFGNNGTALSTVSVQWTASRFRHTINLAVGASGRIVVAGTSAGTGASHHFLVARFNSNGSLDTTFGAAGNGVVTTDASGPGGVDYAYSLALQGDGKILEGGLAIPANQNSGLDALARYNPDGTLDATFNGNGIATAAAEMNYVSGVEADALVIQPDGKIVTAGQGSYLATRPDGSTYQSSNMVLAIRFNPDGSRDTSYGPSGTGAVMTSLGYNADVSAMALQPDGRTVVAGEMNTSGPSASDPSPYLEYFALTRFTASSAAPSPVQVGSFTASATTVTAGSPVTLTAGAITTTSPGATITQVAFYSVDSFGTEQLLGCGTTNADGTWTLTFTVNLASGSYTLLAMAVDSTGAISDPFALSLNVV
jgi:uncharacterized delta-60 repeat protein